MVTQLFKAFFRSEKAGGLLLLACTALSLLWSNSPWQASYLSFWQLPVGTHSLVEVINDGLMTLFFLLIGLELERELYQGELSTPKDAALPVVAALGGMLVPAGIYLLFNAGTPTQRGAGIPMATDIAFALAVLSLLGRRVPVALKVFLTALAIIDDLGAIVVIGLVYSKGLSLIHLGIAGGIWGTLLLLNRLRVQTLIPYLVGGAAMWYFMLHSGVHATLTGVLVAFAIPFGDGSEHSASYRLQQFLHQPVAFIILPLFALANTALPIGNIASGTFVQPYSLGIGLGLVLGKPIGILLACALAIRLRWGKLPAGMTWKQLAGVGLLAGIGFTMSVFITLLAFEADALIQGAKLTILSASLLAAVAGYVVLRKLLPAPTPGSETND